MKLGMDFGTTNTAVSCLRHEEPDPLGFGDHKDKYVPSVMARRTRPVAREYFGWEAKIKIGEPGIEVFQNFKMLLGEGPEVVCRHWGAGAGAGCPEEVTRKFIAALLGQIREDHKLEPEAMVVTVPEVWLAQNLLTKREQLIGCFTDQGIANVAIHSEPVAAAVYYLHRYRQEKQGMFNGHLLVCDCGGGTMDFCLVRVEAMDGDRPGMTVLDRAGNGMVNGCIGSAGVAFDMAVVESLLPKLREEDPIRFFKRVREFEQSKIYNKNELSEMLALFREVPETVHDEILFQLEDWPVYPGNLTATFDALIKPGIEQALGEVLARVNGYGIDPSDGRTFRVLMVGGFSSFYLVQETVRKAFGNVASTDPRFADLFALEDRALAISKGAALLANDMAEVIETCPVDVGIMGYGQDSDGQPRPVVVTILNKGEEIGKYHQPVWAEKVFHIADTGRNIPVSLEAGPGKHVALDISGNTLESVLPPGVGVGSVIRVGFSVDKSKIFSIHIQDAHDDRSSKATTLGHLMAKTAAPA
jgi:molecular chaperone DnaK